jgi:hypothetical protein
VSVHASLYVRVHNEHVPDSVAGAGPLGSLFAIFATFNFR